MELNKYQSLKQPTDYNKHLLSLVSVVGQLVDNDDNDTVTMLLGDALEHITCMASLNNVTLDTVAGLNVNTYQPDLHKVLIKVMQLLSTKTSTLCMTSLVIKY
ncbi:hypothetical protein [Staphylococcus chromogenes]|uniref:hypothetical protein n=1 Tax=Staphylococcus chromogenes TaxID=46126 RepID=UPI001F543DF0|nr:hypothetical protein [Staphylococcus chromogenes]